MLIDLPPDKLVAIAGIAARIFNEVRAAPDEYMQGLWKGDLLGIWQHVFQSFRFSSKRLFKGVSMRKNSKDWDERFYIKADPVKGFVVELV